jgi:hypothetical protein
MENFYLKEEEELFSIIDKVKLSRDVNVALIVPPGTAVLRSIINLRLLQEESTFLGKNIYIITSDTLIKRLSGQAGINILEGQERLRQMQQPLKMGRVVDLRQKTMSDITRETKPIIEEPIIEEPIYPRKYEEGPVFSEPLPEHPEKPKKVRHFKFPRIKVFVLTILIFAVLAGLAYVILIVLPRVQITIVPKKEDVKFNTEFIVDKNIDSTNVEAGKIQGQLFQVEDIATKEFPATGEKQVEEKASGKIVVYNQYSSSPQTLVKTTRFRSPDGKIFRLANTTTIPGATIDEGKIIASSKEVDVAADEAGEAYNIGPSDFKIPGFEGTPKYDAFYGKSTEAMTGGAKGKMKVVTLDDISGATSIVALGLKDKVAKTFVAQIPRDLKLLEESQTLETVETKSSVKANQPGEKFTISVKVRVSGLALNEKDVLYYIEKNIGEEVLGNKTILFSTIKLSYRLSKLDFNKGTANCTCNVEAQAALNIDVQKVKNDLVGQDEIGVRKYLSSLPEIDSAKVIFWPFWVKNVPSDKNKIKVLTKIN